MRNQKVAEGIGYYIYFSDGRYYVNLYRKGEPIKSYATIEGVKEFLYYSGLIDSKTAEI